MESSNVYRIVLKELEGDMVFKEWHRIEKENVKDFLITPYKKQFYDSIDQKIVEYWVVLDEDKLSSSHGYLILFIEDGHNFVLATKTNLKKIKDVGTLIGIYGGLIETINSM